MLQNYVVKDIITWLIKSSIINGFNFKRNYSQHTPKVILHKLDVKFFMEFVVCNQRHSNTAI